MYLILCKQFMKMKKYKALNIFFLIICFACNDNNEKYINSKTLYKKGKLNDALTIIESLDSNKLDYNSKYLKAQILYELNQHENSIRILRTINDFNNDSVNSLISENYWRLALQTEQDNYWDSSITFLKNAIEISGTKFQYQLRLAKALHNKQLHTDAISQLYKTKVQFPDSADILLVNIAQEKYCLGDLSSSLIELLTISKKNKSLDPELYRYLYYIYKDQGKLDSSLYYINKTLDLDSDFSYYHYEKALIFKEMKMYDSACRYLYNAAERGLVLEDMIKDICSKTN